MTYITYANMVAKLQEEMDLEGEEFVSSTEIMAWFNDAIRECESQIHKLGLEDIYFKSSDNPSLVLGTSDYAMPTNIYANKILECVYNDGSSVFEIKRLTGRDKHVRKAFIDNESGSEPTYLYDLINASAAAGVKWKLIPAAKVTSASYVTRWYIREATRMTSDASVCDLPDVCLNFVYAYVGWRVWAKEGDPRVVGAKLERDEQKRLLIEALTEMVPDEENSVEQDMTHYNEAT